MFFGTRNCLAFVVKEILTILFNNDFSWIVKEHTRWTIRKPVTESILGRIINPFGDPDWVAIYELLVSIVTIIHLLFSLHLSQFLRGISWTGSVVASSHLRWRCLLVAIWHNLLLMTILILLLLGADLLLLLVTHGTSSYKDTSISEYSITTWCHSIRIGRCHLIVRLLTIIHCQFLLAFNCASFHFAG